MASAAVASTLICPGRVIGLRDPDKATVILIQQRLNQLGCGPPAEDGDSIRSESHDSGTLRFIGKIATADAAIAGASPVTEA